MRKNFPQVLLLIHTLADLEEKRNLREEEETKKRKEREEGFLSLPPSQPTYRHSYVSAKLETKVNTIPSFRYFRFVNL